MKYLYSFIFLNYLCPMIAFSQERITLDSLSSESWNKRINETFLNSNRSKSVEQREQYIEFFRFRFRQCLDTTSIQSCSCEDFDFYGNFQELFIRFLNLKPDRIVFMGQLPTVKICMDDFIDYCMSEADYQRTFFKLVNHWGFREIDTILQMTDVWTLEKTDSFKLPLYHKAKHGVNQMQIFDPITKDIFAAGISLSTMAYGIASMTERTIECTIDDDNNYTYTIPYTNSLEKLNQYLIKTYGLVLKKSQKVVPITVVKFQ